MPVLSNAGLIDAALDMPHKHVQMQMAAIQCGGACTKKFNQGSDDRTKGVGYWYHQRKKANGSRWGGVCKALSIYWIATHAQEDDFWGWLFSNKGWADALNATEILDLHGEYGSGRGGLSKDNWTLKILQNFGLVEKRGMANGASLTAAGNAGSSYQTLSILAQAIAPNYRRGSDCYKQLSIHSSSGGGHAVAAWVAEDVLFFDPNYGEYWFETPRQFRTWFYQFWCISGYVNKYQAGYKINCYGKPAGNWVKRKAL